MGSPVHNHAQSECFMRVIQGQVVESLYHTPIEDHNQLALVRSNKSPPPIIPVFLDGNNSEWCDADLIFLCQLRSVHAVSYDISNIANDASWISDEGASNYVINKFDMFMKKLSNYIETNKNNGIELKNVYADVVDKDENISFQLKIDNLV
jgi:hypothetical protein